MAEHAVTWFGVVHPEAGNWHLTNPIRVTYDGVDLIISLRRSAFHMVAKDSVKPDDESYEAWLERLGNGYLPALQGVLDALGFSLGANLVPELVGGSVDSHIGIEFATDIPMFANGAEGDQIAPEAFAPTLRAGVGDACARYALRDVARALTFDEDCAFHCYRALEDLRQHYAIDGLSKDEAWTALRADLEIDRNEIEEIQGEATARRHGQAATSTYAERIEWARWTRGVVAMYIRKHAPSDGFVYPHE